MSFIDPEEGHFNDVDGGGAAAPSDEPRSTGLPVHDDDEPSSERAHRRRTSGDRRRDMASPDPDESREPNSPDDLP